MAPKKKEDKEQTLEQIFENLDQTIESLESREISLENSFEKYQEGITLLKQCNQKIDTVEKKMLVLNEDGGTDEF